MKKLSLYVFLVLMWCNFGFAEIFEYGKCYESFKRTIGVDKLAEETGQNPKITTHNSWDDFNKSGSWENITYTINSSNGTLTVSYIQDEEYHAKLIKKLEKKLEKKFDHPRIKQNIYQITNLTSKFITIKGSKFNDLTGEEKYEMFIDLENSTIEKISKILWWSSKIKIICEESPWGASQNDEGSNSSGTAFFINNRGNLITNNHVVEGCELSKINYFNKEYDTNLIATDKTLDLALLKVDLKPKSFISFSKDEPKKRDLIIIAGYPLGEYLSDDLKINEGKISSLKGFDNNSNEITVDLAINPGNSGGPIVNENGQLVAVAVAGMSKDVTEGISFGIKYSAVNNFLKSNKIRPDIGLTSFSMNKDKVNQLLEESTVYIFCE